MRIAISGMFWTEPHVGSGQYLHNLVAQFAASGTNHRFILVVPRYQTLKDHWARPALRHFQTVVMPTPFDQRSKNLAKVWFEQIAFQQVGRKLRADVLHVPYFGSPRHSATPIVVTVHDLIPLLLPEYRGSRAVQLYMRIAASGARRASAIIADSHHTRSDIIRQLGVSAEKVAVTHLAAAPAFQPQPADIVNAVRDRFRLADPYIYYVGGFDARKNVATAIRAFARAKQRFERPVKLAIAGRVPAADAPLFPDMHRVILDENVAADVVLLGPVSQNESAALMSGCEAFVYPSHYEGFGLPPLEAMQCGAAVLASSTTSVGEVVGDGGVQLPPDDVDAWAEALIRVVADAGWREALGERARARAAAFRWDETARQTMEIYEQVDSSRPRTV